MRVGATDSPSIVQDRVAVALRGFGPVGIVAILAILIGNFLFLPLSAILVLVWARLSRTPLHQIGYVRPKSWVSSVIVGTVFGISLKVLMKAVVMPVLGAPPTNPTFHYLVGNTSALPGILYLVIVGAGFGEETVFRGWMFERLGTLLGNSLVARISVVLITSMLFGLVHYSSQGIAGTQQATIVGLVFGTVFATTHRIFMLMIAHAAFDLIAVAIIYWDLESAVAHLFFK